MPDKTVGVLVVHGVGEQRRFNHLEAQVRHLVAAMEDAQSGLDHRQLSRITVEVRSSTDSEFGAEREMWLAEGQAPVRVDVLSANGDLTRIDFREVWWADLDEPATPLNRIRFWAWGLSQWTLRGFRAGKLIGAAKMFLPGNENQRPPLIKLMDRVRLFAVGVIFVLILGSISLFAYAGRRLGFRLENVGPDRIAIGPELFVKYVGDVKLYQQKKWMGQGSLQDKGYPPRVAIRRRMIRALVDMALEDYERWYVLAHSLGTVAAFNGLMETGHCIPNYLDQGRWNHCVSAGIGGVGPLETKWLTDCMMPHRPSWLRDNNVIHRDKLFENLHGFLTYGSPLDKFATLWPVIVPLNRDQYVFNDNFEWINIFDALDPVGGKLDQFYHDPCMQPLPVPGSGKKQAEPVNLSYKVHWFFGLTHIRYMNFGANNPSWLVSIVADWLLAGGPFPSGTIDRIKWLDPEGVGTRARNANRILQWGVVAVFMAVVIALWTDPIVRIMIELLGNVSILTDFVDWLKMALAGPNLYLKSLPYISRFLSLSGIVVTIAIAVVIIAGAIRKLRHKVVG